MIDGAHTDEVRRFAAVQLCALGAGLEIQSVLVARLSEEQKGALIGPGRMVSVENRRFNGFPIGRVLPVENPGHMSPTARIVFAQGRIAGASVACSSLLPRLRSAPDLPLSPRDRHFQLSTLQISNWDLAL